MNFDLEVLFAALLDTAHDGGVFIPRSSLMKDYSGRAIAISPDHDGVYLSVVSESEIEYEEEFLTDEDE